MNRQITYSVSAGSKLIFTYKWSYEFAAWVQINHAFGAPLLAIADEFVMQRSIDMFRGEADFILKETLCAWCDHPPEVRSSWRPELKLSHGMCPACHQAAQEELKSFAV